MEAAMTNRSAASRVVRRVVKGMPTSDGAGVKLRRVIGQPQLPDLDPFLMLDEFGTDRAEDYLAGFPDHPHRGFETVTYVLEGQFGHKDSAGHSGTLRARSCCSGSCHARLRTCRAENPRRPVAALRACS